MTRHAAVLILVSQAIWYRLWFSVIVRHRRTTERNIKQVSGSGNALAFACAMTAVIIWGWWMSATRVASTSGIAPIDVALLRYGIPAFMLCPVWLPMFRRLRNAPLWALLATLGWGAPFLWLVAASLETANVIYLATIVPCTMPLFALLAERVIFNIRPSRSQLCGFTLIGLAAVVVLLTALGGGGRIDLYSLSLMLLAAAGWACYVVAFRHTGLTAAQAAAWVCTMSTLLILIVKFLSGSAYLTMTIDQLLFHGLAQGVLSGFVAVILYTVAINRLGTARAASFTVLIPLMGAGFAWAWLGEKPLWIDAVALAIGSFGVAVVNGLLLSPSRKH